MRTIEQICEDETGMNAMDFMKRDGEDLKKFFIENNKEWVYNLLQDYSGKLEAIPSPRNMITAFLGEDVDVDVEELEAHFYHHEHNGTLVVFEDGNSMHYDQNTRYSGHKKFIVVDAIEDAEEGDFGDWYSGEFFR